MERKDLVLERKQTQSTANYDDKIQKQRLDLDANHF